MKSYWDELTSWNYPFRAFWQENLIIIIYLCPKTEKIWITNMITLMFINPLLAQPPFESCLWGDLRVRIGRGWGVGAVVSSQWHLSRSSLSLQRLGTSGRLGEGQPENYDKNINTNHHDNLSSRDIAILGRCWLFKVSRTIIYNKKL